MAGRRTNLLLLVLLAAALVTGTLAFALGTPALGRAVVVAHGVVGLAVVVTSPWKSVIVRRGLRRERPGRAVSVLLGVLVLAAVASGVAHSAGARDLAFGVTVMQVHVGTALGAIPVAVVHLVTRPVRPRTTDLSRRALLRGGGIAGVAGVAWLALEGGWRVAALRGARRRFTGSHEVGSGRPAAMPVTQWFDDPVPRLDADGWHLVVADRDGTRTLALTDLPGGDGVQAVLDCTGGWYAEQEWTGVRLDRIVTPAAGDRSVVVVSVTGYARRLPVDALPDLLLATAVGEAPLSVGHGFPARLVAPGRRGFWWVKWVTEVRTDRAPPWAQPPFPLT